MPSVEKILQIRFLNNYIPMLVHVCILHSFHLKGFSLSSGHFATWLYGNRTFLSLSLTKGSGGGNTDENICIKLPSVKFTLLEVFIQVEEPVENSENFFFVEKCAVLQNSESTMGRCQCLRDIENSRLVHFHSHCQWVHLVCLSE